MRRLAFLIGWELVGLLLLVTFVVALSTMPPLQVSRSSRAVLGYRVWVDTDRWQQNVQTYGETLAQGTLGKSRNGFPVSTLLFGRLAQSLQLLSLSLVLAVVLGVWKGVRDFRQLHAGRAAAGPVVTGMVQGMPDFWLVMVLQLAAVQLYKASALRPLPPVYDDRMPVTSMVLPVLCLTLIPWAYVARMTSTAMQTVFDMDYIRTARAKGLSEWAVVVKHALGAAAVPILDGLPNALAVMFSNLLVVEYLFRYPGITIMLKDAVNPLPPSTDIHVPVPPADVPVLVPAGTALGLLVWLLHLAVVVLRRGADPRLKAGENP